MHNRIKYFAACVLTCLLYGCFPQPLNNPANNKIGNISISESAETDQKDEVAMYIHLYDHLPSNYMTKKEARKHGWEAGALSKLLPGKSIGGDKYGNYEETLPVEDTYYECDIDTQGKTSRGKKRIVYPEDGDIWYTDDHYETFEQLYEGE